MSNDGKHHFPSEGVFSSATFICRHIACIYTAVSKVSELNTAVLLQMEMELQVPSAWEIKRRKNGK